MPQALPLPIRVVVKGPSLISIASGMDGPRSDFTFPRAIEAELLARGRPADVKAISVLSELARQQLRTWERELLAFSPDAVVLGYGQYESVHLFLPRWLERHANSWRTRPGIVREYYRKRVLRPLWIAFAKVQAKLDSVLDPTIRVRKLNRYIADLERLIERIRYVHNPLVIVLEVQPPAKRFHSWFPGMAARIADVNRATAELIERLDEEDIRFFRTTPLLERHAGGDVEIGLPDGFHYTPTMHAVVGRELADVISAWADTQSHLKIDG